MPEPVSMMMVGGGLTGLAIKYAGPRYHLLRDAFDFVGAAILVVLTLPVMALCALIIKLSDPKGPAVFKQTRVGLNGSHFTVFKLRTMRVDAERHTGATWAKKGDPRVLPLCRFMRLSHLDELPQLFNVLRGEMSLVGPRPERPEIIRELMQDIPNYLDRHQVKPGITGLAQIHNGYDQDVESARRKVDLDLEYVRTQSWATDVKILARTVMMVTGKGAH